MSQIDIIPREGSPIHVLQREDGSVRLLMNLPQRGLQMTDEPGKAVENSHLTLEIPPPEARALRAYLGAFA